MTAAEPQASSAGLEAALASARQVYAANNPGSLAAYTTASQSLPGGGTRTTLAADPFPLYIVKGEGATLTDVDGHVYQDFLSDYTSGIYGKSNAVIHTAIQDALGKGLQFGAHNTHEAQLAAGLVSRFPSMDLVRFTNSGTEANLLAIGAGLKFTKRNKVVVFDGAYHGSLLCHFKAEETEPEGVVRAPFNFIIAPYNDIDGTEKLLSSIESEIGVILVEPMLGAGGCVPAEEPFLRGLRHLATRIGAVLIFDEVQTARLSTGGRQALLNIIPDMTTIGKFFGGGFAFGAFGGRREIMSMFDSSRPGAVSHGGTFNNSPLTMVAGATALTLLTEKALSTLNARGDRLRDGLNKAFAQQKLPFSVTGLGSINQLYCSLAPSLRAAAQELLFFYLIEQGYWTAQRGTLCLSFENTDADVDAFVEAVTNCASKVTASIQ